MLPQHIRRWWIVLLLVVTACGHVGSHPRAAAAASSTPTESLAPINSPTPSPSPAATPSSPGPLFAALEATPGSRPVTWNTVVIAGLDGYARAKTTFTPAPIPLIGCFLGPVIPLPAQVVDGRVYFADGQGAIRSITPQGQVDYITSFPLTSSQQMLSFAVSPDGTQLLGAILTLPPPQPCSNSASAARTPAPVDVTVDVYSGLPFQASVLLYHRDLGREGFKLWGWDSTGPLAVYPDGWATEGGGPFPGERYFGTLVRLDPRTGRVQSQVSDASCVVEDNAQNGDYVCTEPSSHKIRVRRQDGTEIWHWTTAANNYYSGDLLSPDESHIAVWEGGPLLLGKDGLKFGMPDTFGVGGWLDYATIVGNGWSSTDYPSALEYVKLNNPAHPVAIGFSGLFVGAIA